MSEVQKTLTNWRLKCVQDKVSCLWLQLCINCSVTRRTFNVTMYFPTQRLLVGVHHLHQLLCNLSYLPYLTLLMIRCKTWPAYTTFSLKATFKVFFADLWVPGSLTKLNLESGSLDSCVCVRVRLEMLPLKNISLIKFI